jgi:ribosome biogenesis GTPase A
MKTIQWFPGHMAKARRQVSENLKLVDIVIELLDARIPIASRNPMIHVILGNKPRVVLLNKADLADPQTTKAWTTKFTAEGTPAVVVNSLNGEGINNVPKVARELVAPLMAARAAKGIRPRAIRAMIVGIPNVGKSSFINRLTKGNTAKTGDKPGVTRGPQWIKVNPEFELLDTPGILWPKFDDPKVGLSLAFTGAISDLVLDSEELAVKLLERVAQLKPEALMQRYKLPEIPTEPFDTLHEIGTRRGCLVHRGQVDYSKVATLVIKEFREGLIGRISLEQVKD